MSSVVFLEPPAAKVDLIAITPNAAEVIATASRSYGHVLEPDFPDAEYTNLALAELQKTALRGPVEMVHLLFLIRNVTRAWTHQAVRYRVGTSFIQESLRFSQKREAKVLDTTGGNLEFRTGAEAAMAAYWRMIDSGIPTEDARGVLPTNILTALFWDMSLATFVHVWEQRACAAQAQAEWQGVLGKMRATLPDIRIKRLLKLACDTGPCPYQSMWDRKECSRKEAV